MTQKTPDPEVLETLQLDPGGSRPWLPWALGAIVVLVAAVIAWSLGADDEPEVVLERVERGTLIVTVEAVGNLEPLNEVEIGPELSGIVASVPVSANQKVAAGDVLASLDTTLLEAQEQQAEAEVATARATLRQAQVQQEAAALERRRAEEVAKGGSVAPSELDRVRLNHEAALAGAELAEAQLQRALAARRVARTNLDKAVLRSPTDGVVLERNVDPGQAVVTSLQSPVLFRVAERLDEMLLVIQIDEADIARVQEGQEATFTVAAWPARTFDAVVRQVHLAPMPGSDVVTYEAELHVANEEGLLRPGMSASVTLRADEQDDVLMVPNAALRFEPPTAPRDVPTAPHIWVSGSDGLAPVVVSLGPSNRSHTAVTSEADLVGAEVAVAVVSP